MSKGHSIADILDKTLVSENTDELTREELFERGFTAYRFPNSIFLSLSIKTFIKTKCPVNGSEDIIKVFIDYKVNKFGDLVEHHSFLNWLDTFENLGMGLEASCSEIYERIDEIIKPNQLKVKCVSHSNFRSENTATREKDF